VAELRFGDLCPDHSKTGLAIFAIIASVLIGIPLISFSWMKTARLRGEYQAYLDMRSGQYLELGYGLPSPWRSDFAKLVHHRHPEAQFRSVASCIVSPGLQEYVRGYNDYAEQAAKKHFGHDVFQEAFDDAKNAYNAKSDVATQD
jgi:hypothetical protein